MKSLVIAITPSPTLDLGGVVDKLRPNEKSYVHDELKSPGGNAINAARILTRMKIPVLTTGFLGGSIGNEIKYLLNKEGVANRFVGIKGHSRVCVTVTNKADYKQTRLVFPGPLIKKNEKDELLKLIKKQQRMSLLLLGGSIPSGFEIEDAIQMVRIAKKKGADCIVDCPASILAELLDEKLLLIKPNLLEFQELTKSRAKTISEVHKESMKLLDRVKIVCVSSVEGGALITTKQSSFFGTIPDIKIRSTVGAGDSMVGAMVAQIYRQNISADELLRWGLGAAAATLTQFGTAFGTAKDIRKYYKLTKVKKI